MKMQPEAKEADGKTSATKQEKSPIWLYITVAILFIPMAITVYLMMSNSNSGIMVAKSENRCNLQLGSCQAVFRNGAKVTLSISPRPIHERNQLTLDVRLQGIDAKSVYVNFLGQNMYMGYNRPKLEKIAPGHFAGTWTLASCGLYVEYMEWKTMVLIQTAKQRMAAPFPLVTQPKAGENTE